MLATFCVAKALTRSVKIGKPINAGDAVSTSARILLANPRIILPQLMLLIPALINDALTGSIFSPLSLIISIVSFVLSIVVAGAYPSIVKAAIAGEQFSLTEALGMAYRRCWTLLAAGILVALIVGLGFIALVVPGVILATWYAYTVPAIMLEEKGALEGMAASKAFGRDKKGDTFLIFIAVLVGAITLVAFQSVFSLVSPTVGRLVYSLLDLPFGAWISVTFAYTYIAYGPSSVATTAGAAGYGVATPASPQPAVIGSPSAGVPGGFCRFCGSPIPAGSKFCGSCGKPV